MESNLRRQARTLRSSRHRADPERAPGDPGRLDGEIDSQIEGSDLAGGRVLLTVPGIGPITAAP